MGLGVDSMAPIFYYQLLIANQNAIYNKQFYWPKNVFKINKKAHFCNPLLDVNVDDK